MCIIVVKPAPVQFSINTLMNMWVNNPHGAGFMCSDGNELTVVKGLMNFEHFLGEYYKHAAKKMVMHFRWRTHGPVRKTLTHPFKIAENVAFVHNGMIPWVKVKENESDTSVYAETLERRYTDVFAALERPQTRKFIVGEIGFSKLAFMNSVGTVKILNGQMGHMGDNGCWYSNHSYKNFLSYDKKYGNVDYNRNLWIPSADVLTL